jgi:hypothetical protein
MTLDEELQQLLSRAELERLRGILEDRDDAVLSLVSGAAEVLWASRSGASTVFGRPELAEYRGQSALQYVHPDDQDTYVTAFGVAQAGGTPSWEGQALDGKGGWVRVRTIMWRTQNGTETVMVTVPVGTAGS